MADVRDAAAIERAIGDFTSRTDGQRLDAVFANAGVLFMGPHETITPAQKQLLVDVNVSGVVHTIDAAFPFLQRTPGAHVVAMSSTSAEYGAPQHAVYSATKFFVRGLTEALNIEYRAHGIQVSAIYVAYVQTGMVFGAQRQARFDRAAWREDHAGTRRSGGLARGARQSRPLARGPRREAHQLVGPAVRRESRADLCLAHAGLRLRTARAACSRR